MGFDLGTSSTYNPPNANLIYVYSGACNGASGTSHIVAKVDNVPYDMAGATLTSAYVTAGNQMSGTHRINNVLDLNVIFKLVNNPSTGINADTMQYKFIARNVDSVAHHAALRLEIDTMVMNNDGTNISIDNGATVIGFNTAWYKSSANIPANWWDYDVDPHTGTPSLVGRGHVKNNPSGEAATEPDIFEVASWSEVSGFGQWTMASSGTQIFSDSAVVYWWLNGSDPSAAGYNLAPGQSMTWIAYYGLNQGVLLATPTVTGVFTRTVTQTPTIYITHTITQTRTVTPSRTRTHTLTITPTSTISMTHTITMTRTITMTETITPTITLTPPDCYIVDLGPYPNPSDGGTTVAYMIPKTCDVNVKIFSVSGELVWEEKQGDRQPGRNSFYWDSRNMRDKKAASGTYVYKITALDKYGNTCWCMSKLALAW
jgi:hypothetical protein